MNRSVAVLLSILGTCFLGTGLEAAGQEPDTVVVVENPEAVVYAYGHRLTSPFVLEVASDTLWLNGYPVSPVVRFRPAHPWTTPPTPPPEAEEFCRVWGIMLGLQNKARTQDSVLVAQGLPYEEIKKRSAAFWASHELVDSACVRSSGVAVHYKCETCTAGPYLPFFHTVAKDWTPYRRLPIREYRLRSLEAFKREIEQGWAILIGDGYHDLAGGELRGAVEDVWKSGVADSVWGPEHIRAVRDLAYPRAIVPRGGERR